MVKGKLGFFSHSSTDPPPSRFSLNTDPKLSPSFLSFVLFEMIARADSRETLNKKRKSWERKIFKSTVQHLERKVHSRKKNFRKLPSSTRNSDIQEFRGTQLNFRQLLVAQTTPRCTVVLFLTNGDLRTLAAFLKGCFEESGQRNRWSLYLNQQNIKGSTMVARFLSLSLSSSSCLGFLENSVASYVTSNDASKERKL